ncbi:MAG TPA: hypothetical protein PK866_13790, partial [Nitrospira sp.]|nr:hypothetical protein [Nitrospira sp.]
YASPPRIAAASLNGIVERLREHAHKSHTDSSDHAAGRLVSLAKHIDGPDICRMRKWAVQQGLSE